MCASVCACTRMFANVCVFAAPADSVKRKRNALGPGPAEVSAKTWT